MSASRSRAPGGLRRLHPISEAAVGKQSWTRATTTAIVFVHGLGADPNRTWKNGDTCWITDFLPDDLGERGLGSSVQLFTFDYDSYWLRNADSTSLRVTADSLALELTRGEVRQYNLVLVGHSYGGLVVKKALVINVNKLKSRVKGVFFLGTPHKGTKFVRFGTATAKLMAPFDSDLEIMRPLAVDNMDLDDLEKDFHEEFVHTPRRYFFETRKTRRYLYIRELVVSQQSATFGARRTEAIALDTDHQGLNKFPSRDNNYQKFVRELFAVLQGPGDTAKSLIDTLTNPSPSHQNVNPPEVADETQPGHWLVPFTDNPDFVGRTSILDEMKQQLGHSQKSVTHRARPRVSLFGLGGVGKTQVALAYVHWLRRTYPEMSVFWVHAGTSGRFRQGYIEIARLCSIPGCSDPNANMLRLVKDWLEKKHLGRWLMVVDNADDTHVFFPAQEGGDVELETGDNLADYLPDCQHGSILITSRNKQAALKLIKGHPPIQVDRMGDDEACQLLLTKLKDSPDFADKAVMLSSRLEHLPLALSQAAAFIQENSITISKYLELLDKDDQTFLNLLSRNFEAVGRDSQTPHAVTATWVLSFELVQQQHPLAGDFLSVMSLVDRQGIPRSFISDFYTGRNQPSQMGEDIELETSLGVLKAFSFVTEQEDGSLNMHRLVQLVTQKWLTQKGMMEAVTEKALEAVASGFPNWEYETRDVCNKYIPHACAVLSMASPELMSDTKARTHRTLASSFYTLGRYGEAGRHCLKALDMYKATVGEESLETLACMSNMANAQAMQGRYKQSTEMLERVAEGRGRLLGEEHPLTLSCTARLAHYLHRLGERERPQEVLLQVLEVQKRVLGDTHADTLETMRNLAVGYLELDPPSLGEAEKLMRMVLEAQKKRFGEVSPKIIITIGLLANICQKQNRFGEADLLLVKAVEASLSIFGKEHPETLRHQGNLAISYIHQGRLDEAEKLMSSVLEASMVLGTENEHYAYSLSIMASVYWAQGKHEDAVRLNHECLSTQQRVYDPDYWEIRETEKKLDKWESFLTRNKEEASLARNKGEASLARSKEEAYLTQRKGKRRFRVFRSIRG
ncbi:hypothetical protein B0T25DRAFT_72891 [Lasiosphaeria hispida]|uniref:AB hydrolase-1 domain-containing protein n=1 Tax=Lasiosphaeria hispida TaxID=260671 RepID=A0AAJ0HNS8_9PEZI|nr:hypothetical protein B0T25DRAFT_72891 [Lasiosphaeria hispida]